MSIKGIMGRATNQSIYNTDPEVEIIRTMPLNSVGLSN
jgi:hypothetical protein